MASLSVENYNPEEYLLDTLNDLDIGFVKVGNDDIILNHNLTFNKIFGYNLEASLIGTKILDYWLDSEERNKFREDLFKNGIVKKYLAPVKKVDGEKIFLQVNFKLNKNSNGEVTSTEGTFVDVTERMEKEKKLKESEHNLSERVKELTCLYGLSKIVENPDISSEAILRGALNLIPPAWQFPEITCAKINFNNKEFKTSNFKETEWKLSTKINVLEEEMIIEVYYLEDKPFLNEEEHLISDIGKRLKSIIEQRETQQKLRASEEWFSTTLKSVGDAVIATDRLGNIQFINPIAEDLTGFKREESIGKPIEDVFNIINEETCKSVENPVSRVIREGAIVGLANHTVLITQDRKEIPIADSGAPIKDDKGNLIGIVLIFRDVTERRKAENELRLQSKIIENISEGVFLIKLDDGTIAFTNPAFDELFGYNPSEMISKNIAIVNAPTDKTPEETREEIKGILKDTGEWHGEVLNVKKDGTLFWCYANISLFEHPEYGTVFVAVNTDITERKQSEEKVRELIKRYERLTDNADEAIFRVKAKEGYVVYQNSAAKRIFGYSLADWQSDPLFGYKIIHPDFVEKQKQIMEEINNKKKPMKNVILGWIAKDGHEIILEYTIIPLLDENGDVAYFESIGVDISERKKAEQKLKESEEKYRMLFESSTDGIASVDMEGRIIDVNNAFLKMLGYSKEELLRLNFKNFTPQKWHEMEDNLITSQLSEGSDSSIIYEKEYIKKDGTIFPINARFWIIKDVQGDPVRIWRIVRDLTDRKKKEKEIIALAQFPSENPYPVLRVNINRVMYINEAGQKLLNVVDSDQIPEIFKENVKKAFEINKIAESEVELDSRTYSFIITPVKDADYVNIYGMDITERKRVEEKLKEINQLKSEFLRRASHELKAPLISIKGFSELILSLHGDQLETSIISKLREINDGCERLQNIINNLLKTSRLESPDLKPNVQKEDLSFLINFCVHELESLAEVRKQSIKLDIHDEIYANIEKEEIHDVLSNLLSNAIKYTPPMGKIEIKTELHEDSVVVSVKDNGIGFNEVQKTKIFHQFGKIERYGQGLDLGIDGTGLGLYISKRIVESHGGKLWMESEGKNKGSSFYFTIPTAKDTTPA